MKCHTCYWWFLILFGDMSDMFHVHYYALTLFLDRTLWLVTQIRIHSLSGLFICMFRFSYVHDHSEYSLIPSSIVMIDLFYQQRPDFRDLEGCYDLYRTFPISNLTLEPIRFFIDHLFQIRSHTQGFLSYFVYTLKKISDDSKSLS